MKIKQLNWFKSMPSNTNIYHLNYENHARYEYQSIFLNIENLKFYFIFSFIKVWSVLTENMSFQEFCEFIHIYSKNDIITRDSPTETYILDTLINSKNEQIKK